MAVIGQALLTPEPGWQRKDDRDANIAYVGTWHQDTNAGFYAGTNTHTLAFGSQLQFNMVSTRLRLLGVINNNHSTSVDVYVDGVKVSTINQYNASPIDCALDCDIQGLIAGEHYVSVVNNQDGVYYTFDALDIDNGGVLKPYNPSISIAKHRPQVI